MFSLPIEEYEWKESASGNYVCIDSGDLIATVFCKNVCDAWKIIINSDGDRHFVANEAFDDHDEAMERAEEILKGADCTLVLISPEDETTSWRQQKTVSNGSPTYGRKHVGVGVSVKKAKSGQWFNITYTGSDTSEPQGWYGSAEEAMQAFDNKHS